LKVESRKQLVDRALQDENQKQHCTYGIELVPILGSLPTFFALLHLRQVLSVAIILTFFRFKAVLNNPQ
jgi:hypothetical protein